MFYYACKWIIGNVNSLFEMLCLYIYIYIYIFIFFICSYDLSKVQNKTWFGISFRLIYTYFIAKQKFKICTTFTISAWYKIIHKGFIDKK
jgi:hypothetical protein